MVLNLDPNQFNQQGLNGNPYRNQPNYQPNRGLTDPYQSNNQWHSGNQFNANGNPFNNRSQFNNGNQYPSQSNIGASNQGIHPTSNINAVQTNQNSFNQPTQATVYQKPDYDPNRVALAPFPDVRSFPNNHVNNGQLFNNREHVQNQQPPINIQPDVNSRFNSNGPSQIPLAGYTGAHVPLA